MVSATGSKHLVGAHYGPADWLAQRVTGVVMLVYSLLLLGIVLWHGGIDHASWLALFENQPFRIATFLFMAALAWHAWVGMRNISMDYVKPIAIRMTLQAAIVVALIAYLAWTVAILWGSH